MSNRIPSLIRAFDKDASLGLGIVVLVIGFLLRFVSPIEIFVELWLFSVAGTVVLALGLLLVVAGFIRLFTDKESDHSLNDGTRLVSKKDLEKKYSEIGLTDSSSGLEAVKTLAEVGKPLSRKEISEKSGLSNTRLAEVLKPFVKKSYATEFEVRGSLYYVLTEKGLRLSEDIKAATQRQEPTQSENMRHMLKENWSQKKLNEHKPTYHDGKVVTTKQRILREQLALVLGFFGGLFIHFGIGFGMLSIFTQVSTIPLILTLSMIVWLASTILFTRRAVGNLGVITLALAWISGFIVVRGDPLTSMGVTLLTSSMAIGAFAGLYS